MFKRLIGIAALALSCTAQAQPQPRHAQQRPRRAVPQKPQRQTAQEEGHGVFGQQAKAEGQAAVAKYFDFANQVEEIHANLYKKALENPAGLAATDYYVCKVCGYTHEGPCDACPVCGGGAAAFFKVED